jgi:carboxylesterase
VRVRVHVHVDAEPFSLGAGDRGVLLLHGFTGSPFEMRLLGEALVQRGFAVEAPRLAGHGARTRDLARTTWHDWYRSAVEALDRLRERVGQKKVAVCGMSMGGLLALEMARQRPDDLATIVVMSAPLWLPPAAAVFANVTSRLPVVRRVAFPKIAGSDIKDREMKRRNERAQGRAMMPVTALASLVDLGNYLRDKLGDVKTPTLLMQAEHDHTVPYECMDAIAYRLGTDEYHKIVLRQSYHVITLDVEHDKVFASVADWVGRYI